MAAKRVESRILADVHDAVIAVDAQWHVTYMNAAAERQYDVLAREVLGHGLDEIYRRAGGAGAFAADPLPRERPEHHVHIKRSGEAIYVESAVADLLDETGEPSGQLRVIRDVTDGRTTEKLLRASDERYSVLLDSMEEGFCLLGMIFDKEGKVVDCEYVQANKAFEMQMGLSEVAGKRVGELQPGQEGYWDEVYTSIVRTGGSRITEGEIELRREPVAVQEIVSNVVNAIIPACRANNQKLNVSVPAAALMLDAAATRIEQVLGNLLGNACRYSGAGSRITLIAEAVDGEAVIRIRDNGSGIDPEILPRIFDLFVQSSRTLDRAHGGLGIGLTIAHRLVVLHGGSIEAQSRGLGQGAEFVVRLPRLSGHAGLAGAPGELQTNHRALKILIVDDNEDAAKSMATLQELEGHEARVALSGPEAIAVAEEFEPAVVLLDIGLPGMDGFEVVRHLRTLPEVKGAFMVALTGYGTQDDRERAKEAGFDEHLAKPANFGLLRDWFRELGTEQAFGD